MSDSVTVIGGAGFIGSHVSDQLTKIGYKVKIFDIKESPYLQKGQKIYTGDILDHGALHESIAGSKYVYNFAGVAEIKKAGSSPLDSLEQNILGTARSIDIAVKEGVEKYIFASSMYVYSDDEGGFYRTSKLSAESIIETYNKQYGINYVLLRYGTLYGPRAQSWNSLNKYVYQALNKGKIEYIGTGEEIREYIHVKDAARLSVDMIDTKYQNKSINITGTQVYTSLEMLNMIKEIANNKVEIQFKSSKESSDHYKTTPYRYIPKKAMKLVPEEFVDLGSGILDLMEKSDTED
ncbi:MAG: NAD-dependent epimerase [Euryarchaeota archaeon]|nr:NAD-dependent epimerase [Euryarchaeota archaeon]|tara:strand:+ start:73 stop:951 length:879 start_codon:yes stop_codon:yes gene_type:complete